ncbi:MAG TPA: hypothetical protein VGO62_20530 [Myxococcota bacterium]
MPTCHANADGTIERAEMPYLIGATERIRVGTHVPVDVNGKPGRSTQEPGQGSARVWDLSRPDPDGEATGLLTLEDIHGQWFADQFPSANVAGPLAPSSSSPAGDDTLLGPLALTDQGVQLLGSASKGEHPSDGQTLLIYDTPVLLYPFPLALGTHVVTDARAIDGLAEGIPVAVDDTYTVDVTAHGQVILPDLILDDALRVTIRLERTPVAGNAVQQVSQVFVTECLGEVARFVSPFVPLDQPLDDDFPVADQVWRLSL